ncbi:MAG: site-specific integrase [Gemmatimonadales bacterium]
MSVYRRGATYLIEIRRKSLRLRCTSGVTVKATAQRIEATLLELWELGRGDWLERIQAGTLSAKEVHERWTATKGAEGAEAKFRSWLQAETTPALGALVEEWLAYLRHPATLVPRRKRPYSPATVCRYVDSWARMLESVGQGDRQAGRSAPLNNLTPGWWADFRATRKGAGVSGAAVNRDATALGSFSRWCRETRALTPPVIRIEYEQEPPGRMRYLSPEELRALENVLAPGWATFVQFLTLTGLRFGEAAPLRWRNVDLEQRRVSVEITKGGYQSGYRLVGLPEGLTTRLGALKQRARMPFSPDFYVFAWYEGESIENRSAVFYNRAQRVFRLACAKAGILGARLHDLRHTFAVGLAQGGVPVTRIQQRLGHSTPRMALRYMRTNPNELLQEDADLLERRLTGDATPPRLRQVNE